MEHGGVGLHAPLAKFGSRKLASSHTMRSSRVRMHPSLLLLNDSQLMAVSRIRPLEGFDCCLLLQKFLTMAGHDEGPDDHDSANYDEG